ncbi:MAG: nucleotide sugar dehydrogenase [bacterium]
MNNKETLIEKLNNKSAVIGIVGLGYVGLPLVIRFAEEGFKVLGIDIDESKISKLNAGKSYIEHIPADAIHRSRKAGFRATANFAEASEADALIICVPTPLDEHREPDMSYVIGTVESLIPNIRAGQLMSLESTTYPGTTDEELLPRIQARGFTVGKNYFLTFSPEREDPGNQKFNTRTIPKVCGGITPACRDVGVALYSSIIDQVVPVSSTRVAEMTKLLENIHRSVNIGLVNEMKIVADRMGIDIHEVIKAAATKPFGFVPYQPGPGLGGHCIPIDPFYLTWKAREYGVHTRFIELAGEVNSGMPEWVIGKLSDALNDRSQSVKSSKVLVLGLAYKKDVDDPRESPSCILMELLRKRGAKVAYSDPHFPSFPKMREHKFDLKSVALTPKSIASYDCILLATNHSSFDYKMIKKNARLIVDTRNAYPEPAKNVIKA